MKRGPNSSGYPWRIAAGVVATGVAATALAASLPREHFPDIFGHSKPSPTALCNPDKATFWQQATPAERPESYQRLLPWANKEALRHALVGHVICKPSLRGKDIGTTTMEVGGVECIPIDSSPGGVDVTDLCLELPEGAELAITLPALPQLPPENEYVSPPTTEIV